MSRTLYACAHAAEFPAQALLRLRPDLASKSVVVLEGQPPKETVCALNRQARQRGVAAGMTKLEVEELGGFALLPRSAASEAAARVVFLECAAQFSPRVAEVSRKTNMDAAYASGTACTFVLDIGGTERLFGPPQQLAARLRSAFAGAGFRVSIAVSANYHAARMKAAATRGIVVIPAGAEAAALENLPLTALDLDQDQGKTFALWGVRTLGELARMPEVELVARLGPAACTWLQLARGEAEHTFEPIEPELALEEFCEFEDPVEQIDSLLFVGARMIDCLVARAEARALALAALTLDLKLDLKLEDGRVPQRVYRRVLRPALPSTDRKFLLKLLQLEIGAHPPPAAVVAFTLAAQAGRPGKVQLGLFVPPSPEPSRLDVTLARLKAMVGEDRVGAPALEDTHRAGSFRMEGFAGLLPILAPKDSARMGQLASPARMALRRVRPPTPVRVEMFPTHLSKCGESMEQPIIPGLKSETGGTRRPIAFRDAGNRCEVTAAYGPWRSSGCWWSGEGWDEEEWDVLARDGARDGALFACLLVGDRARNVWRLEAFYD